MGKLSSHKQGPLERLHGRETLGEHKFKSCFRSYTNGILNYWDTANSLKLYTHVLSTVEAWEVLILWKMLSNYLWRNIGFKKYFKTDWVWETNCFWEGFKVACGLLSIQRDMRKKKWYGLYLFILLLYPPTQFFPTVQHRDVYYIILSIGHYITLFYLEVIFNLH